MVKQTSFIQSFITYRTVDKLRFNLDVLDPHVVVHAVFIQSPTNIQFQLVNLRLRSED